MKKVTLLILYLLASSFLFANEWIFTAVVNLQLSPVNDFVVAPENGNNHFAKISGVSTPVPYGQFAAQYKIPLDFGDSSVFQDANILFVAGPTLTPITFDNQIGVVFTPSPLINFSLGATAGTGWDLLNNHGIAKYDASSDSYKSLKPFTAWKYDLIFQTNLQFDFNVIFPGEWTHVITTANYTVTYEGCTAAQNFEPWFYLSAENVNGLMFSSNIMLGYMLPYKFKLIGLDCAWKGHFNADDFGIYDSNYNGSFVEIVLGLQAMIEFNEKNSLAIVASVPSRRGFKETVALGNPCVSKTAADREWFFNGITVSWIYNF